VDLKRGRESLTPDIHGVTRSKALSWTTAKVISVVYLVKTSNLDRTKGIEEVSRLCTLKMFLSAPLNGMR
jgi:hypothetical protein